MVGGCAMPISVSRAHHLARRDALHAERDLNGCLHRHLESFEAGKKGVDACVEVLAVQTMTASFRVFESLTCHMLPVNYDNFQLQFRALRLLEPMLSLQCTRRLETGIACLVKGCSPHGL